MMRELAGPISCRVLVLWADSKTLNFALWIAGCGPVQSLFSSDLLWATAQVHMCRWNTKSVYLLHAYLHPNIELATVQ
jgi:hypothetical protein